MSQGYNGGHKAEERLWAMTFQHGEATAVSLREDVAWFKQVDEWERSLAQQSEAMKQTGPRVHVPPYNLNFDGQHTYPHSPHSSAMSLEPISGESTQPQPAPFSFSFDDQHLSPSTVDSSAMPLERIFDGSTQPQPA